MDMISILDKWQADNREAEARQGRYKRYLNNPITDKWMEGLADFPEDRRRQVAMILDNQHVFLNGCGNSPYFLQVGMELTRKVLKDLAVFDLVQVQPILQPVGKAYFTKFKYLGQKSETIEGKTYDMPNVVLDLEDCEMTAKTRSIAVTINDGCNVDEAAEKIRDIISHEVITDLRNNAGTVYKKKLTGTEDGVYLSLCYISGIIYRKTMRSGTRWIVASTDIAKHLVNGKYPPFQLPDSIKTVTRVGTLNSAWKVFVDPNIPAGQIVCGHSEPLYDGYIYSPYILLGQSGAQENGERRLLVRYGKKLLCNKHYARIEYE